MQCYFLDFELTLHKKQALPSAPPRKLHTFPVCARSFDYQKNLRNHCQSWHNMSVHIFNRGSFCKSWGQEPHQCVVKKTKAKLAHPDNIKIPFSRCTLSVVWQDIGKKHMLTHRPMPVESVERPCRPQVNSVNMGIYTQDSRPLSVRCPKILSKLVLKTALWNCFWKCIHW